MAKKQGLGRDFYTILDDNMIESKNSTSSSIRIASIEPRSDQPRKDFEHESLEQLAESIGIYGVLQPILVRENPNFEGNYEIIAGERRWRAAKMAGLTEIPAIVLASDDLKAAQVALIENVQREDLNPVEEAFAYQALIDRFGLTQDQVSKQVGKSRSAVTNMLRLLDLPEEVLEMLKDGQITAGHARALLGLKNPDDMMPLAQKIVARSLSVRDIERAIKICNAEEDAPAIDTPETPVTSQRRVYMHDLERRAISRLGRKVRITNTSKKKVIELAYDSDEDLEGLLTLLCGNEFFSES